MLPGWFIYAEVWVSSDFVLYLISCNVFVKQYVESTTERLRFRWNNYQRKAERAKEYMQIYLHEHIVRKDRNGLIYDKEIIIINKIDLFYFTSNRKTLASYGLNVEEGLLMSSLW